MPKKASSGGKKPRWTPAQKAAAKKKAAKRPGAPGAKKHHRGQPDGPTKRPRSERSPRWNAEEREARRDGAPTRESRWNHRDRGDRRPAGRDDRRGFRSSDRPDRTSRRDDRPTRGDRYDRGERPARGDRYDRGERPARSDRPARGDRYDRSERPAYRQNRDDRPRTPNRPARGERPAYGQKSFGRKPWEDRDRDRDRPMRRVADPVRRDRHEGRHYDEHRYDLPEQPRTFEEAEAERAEADTWVKYESKAKSGPAEVNADNGFAALGLHERLVERLARDGITEPFPIQAATIPDALAGRDVLGRGQTGSGKTLAFGLPTITRLADGTKPASKRPRALILVPTRELAMQVSDALEPLVHVTGLRHRLVAGGLSYDPQIKALARGIDILVATPGRLADLHERGAVEFDDVQVTILDEADHMAEMGFMTEVTAILDTIPKGGQTLLFSATLDRGIDALVERYLTDPVTHSTDDATAAVSTMSHHIMLIDPNNKKQLTAELAAREGRTVVFVRTQLGADRVARELRERGVLAAAIHGGLSQAVRNRALGAFRDGTLPVLVATDVAARGIHVDDIGLVLQADPPADHKDYLHRAGRTARAGERGAVVTLALPHQKRTMMRLADAAGLDVEPTRVVPGDQHVAAAGGRTPSGVPVPEEQWRPLLEARPQQRGRQGGRPGVRSGGRGGYAGRGQGGPRGGSRSEGYRGRGDRDERGDRDGRGDRGGRGDRSGPRRGSGGRAEWNRDR
ncbi:superfamily II DNA/RNA helicase [Knoellia remsis]|uniref:Superfamily II DNA/RNA helicase n=1 Tax=Knoellia remsis TaxID=407159 RepID=A0A2T0UZ29_9MICO|nr:DEAD/DEAH box helicase [Knoellia remsis]PRY63171.1 superfamily II DNA/RNA helicase [Knoellia remsis]